MRRFFPVVAIVFFYAAVASAQTKVSGTAQCGKPDPQHTIPVGDLPDHTLGVEQAKCTWSKPVEIGGDKSKDATITSTTEMTGTLLRVHGVYVQTMESGEKIFGWYQGTAPVKDGQVTEGLKGTWGYNGGTGKFKGVKGKGTFTCGDDGCALEGEYQLVK